MEKKIKNIGILAHVDAGKTTITENILFLANAIRQQGSVDQGSSVSDSLQVEKERGISVKASSLSFEWEEYTINLIDTPGHVDFSAEVERVLAALDGVILVISAVEGIQAHTLTLWEAAKTMNLPCLIFINKIDRPGADYKVIFDELKYKLNIPVFPVYGALNEGEPEAAIFSVFEKSEEAKGYFHEQAIELLAEHDESLLERYLEGETILFQEIQTIAERLSSEGKIFPVYAGIAKTGLGVENLMHGIIQFLPDAHQDKKDTLSGLVFKIEHDKTLGRLTHIRLFAGEIRNRDELINPKREPIGKVSRLKKHFAGKLKEIEVLKAGDIGIVSGLPKVIAGDVIGNPDFVPRKITLQETVLTVQVVAENEADYTALAEALSIMNAEDPMLDFKWYRTEKEFHLSLMGNIQIEIIQALIRQRFGIETSFKNPEVIYKETPTAEGMGYVEYTMPKPCWAVMRFKVEPGEKGSGIHYSSEVNVNKIHKKYQNEISATISKALKQGIKGWEVTDIKITLIDGEDHEIHSRPGDFILATPMGIMRALQDAGTCFLEPVFQFEIAAPEEYLGSIAGDITKMRGSFKSPVFAGDDFIFKGRVPVASAAKYSIRLNSLTGGKAKLKLRFGGYEACPNEYAKTRSYRGVSPLDESQWILHRRGAFKADEREF